MPLLAAPLLLSLLLHTPTDTAAAVHLLQRATWGARPFDVGQVLTLGRERWLDRQLHPERIDDSALRAQLARFPALRMSVPELYQAFPPPAAARRVQARSRTDGMGADSASPSRAVASRPRQGRQGAGTPAALAQQLIGARVTRAVATERQLEDVMTDFWFNHFNVFWGKGPTRWLIADYERTAIRPHVFGRFEDLLLATAQHPAMLYYLDNWRSAAPDTGGPMAQRVRQPGMRMPGLNENFARELLELHTLGVDGGYTQQDVIAVARAFTGWTIRRPGAMMGQSGAGVEHNQGPEFTFREAMHDRAPKNVLGRTLPPERGKQDGDEVLALLARHPSTARHVATKLARRFVADDPPAALVDHLAGVFLRSDGDLLEVTRALFLADEFYAVRHREAKVKTPFELVVSALRATNATVVNPRGIAQTLRTFGHLPYFQTAPTGYPSASEAWTNSSAMLARMNFGLALAAERIPGVRTNSSGAGVPLDLLVARVLPGTPRPQLVRVIKAELSPAGNESRALGLVLGSPDFQRR